MPIATLSTCGSKLSGVHEAVGKAQTITEGQVFFRRNERALPGNEIAVADALQHRFRKGGPESVVAEHALAGGLFVAGIVISEVEPIGVYRSAAQ